MSASHSLRVPQPADRFPFGQPALIDAAWAGLVERTSAFLARSRAGGLVVTAALEVDRFGEIVVARGTAAAERLLIELGARVDQRLSSFQHELWMGGNLFVLTCALPDGESQLLALREVLVGCSDQGLLSDAIPVAVVTNLGIACATGFDDDPQSLLGAAEAALGEARKMFGTRVVVFDPPARVLLARRFEMTQELHRAVQRSELDLEYQPIVDLGGGKVTGVEALLRWSPSGGETIAPDEFIPRAEESGLIVPIGRWVLREVIRGWSALPVRLAPDSPLAVTVNVSAAQFDGGLGGLREDLETAAAALSGRLMVEVTESRMVLDVDAARQTLDWLRSIGVGIVIDDFGTGYCSLEYLRAFPVDAVKIDRSFIAQIDTDPRDRAIVTSIIDLAHSLGIIAVAEGVEREAQLDILLELACDAAQGFYLAPPESLTAVLTSLSAPSPASHASRRGRRCPKADD